MDAPWLATVLASCTPTAPSLGIKSGFTPITGLLRKDPFQIGTTFGSGPPPGARGAGSGAAGPWTRHGRAVDAPWTREKLSRLAAAVVAGRTRAR